jgi:molecular chaperone GrpE (heat shock protein)
MFGKNKKIDKNKNKKEHEPCLDCQLKMASANEKIVESEDKILRVAAELENYKKRQRREMDLYRKITVQSILLDFCLF